MQISRLIESLLHTRQHQRIPVLPVQLDLIQSLLKRTEAAEGSRARSHRKAQPEQHH